MPQLRKRSAVSYHDEGDEDEEEKVFRVSAPKSRKRKAKSYPDEDEWQEPESGKKRQRSVPKPKSQMKTANNIKAESKELLLSDSGCDSEHEVKTRPPKAKRARKVKEIKEPEVSPYFDWAPVLDQKPDKEQPEKSESVKADEGDASSEEEDWEEVDGVGGEAAAEEVRWDEEPKTLEISMEEQPATKKKSQRCGGLTEDELAAEFRRAWEKHRREAQQDMHIVHLLCLLAHGRRLSFGICSDHLLHAVALSTLPPQLMTSKSSGKATKRRLEQLLEFAAERLGLTSSGTRGESCQNLQQRLLALLEGKREERSRKLRVLAACVLLRAAGCETRLVHVLRPVPLKPVKEEKKKTSRKKQIKRESSDSDFEPGSTSKSSRQMLSEDEEENEELPGPCVTSWWLEVLCGDRWMAVDCERCLVDCADQMERAEDRQGPLYVMAFAADASCRDVTARYARRWCTATRKARLARDLWEEEVLEGLRSTDRLQEVKEDDEIRERLLRLPVPKSTGDYNNHPLYALTRHLKKYEVIYPPDAQPLHFHKGEPAYPRENVLLCHTRETWLKEARIVRMGEEPAKVVDSRMSNKQRALGNSKPLKNELFGRWQTEEYDPPCAEDGIVPKNEHGNVYLFQPCMLPKGCVHLRLNGLGRIGRRLGVDMAQAMIGWEFHGGGWAHPVMDGWVVCKEHASAVRLAWLEQEREAARKAAAKREARTLANWRLLTKGLLIRERLKARYDMQGEATLISSIADGMKEKPR